MLLYSLKSEALPSFGLTLIGSIDCLTTVIGVLYFGAVEINPFLAGIVSANILAFIILKVASIICIAFTYILAKRLLNKSEDKTSRFFKFSNLFFKTAFISVFLFLVIVVANNLVVLMT
jgi:hypothetical protein